MGSSGGDKAQRQAQEQERQRQAQVSATTNQINSIFDSEQRQSQIGDFGTALRDYYRDDADRQKGVADRDLKFALARSGLTGGSRQVDANRTLGEEYQRGILESDRKSQSEMADLRGRDEQARLNLIGLAQSGLNTGTAAQQAAAALRTSLDSANASARVSGLGDLFGSVASTKKRSEEDAARRHADAQYTNQYGPFWAAFGSQ